MAAPRSGLLEALVEGGARGLVLVRDSAACEGRSLLRAFATAAVKRAEPVLVVLLDVPRERFEAGLSPDVKQRLHYHDGLWTPPLPCPMDVGGLLGALGGGGSPSPTLLLDSLSWLLLRLPLPRLGGAIAGLLGGGPEGGRLVALVHEDLHPPPVLRALGAVASAQLVLGGPAPFAPPPSQTPPPAPPRLVRVLTRPRRGGGTRKDEAFTLHPDGTLGVPPPLLAMEGEGGGPPPTPPSGGAPPPITFRLRLSEAERAARAAVPPPYEHRSSMQGVPIDPDPPEDEDPDEDLDV